MAFTPRLKAFCSAAVALLLSFLAAGCRPASPETSAPANGVLALPDLAPLDLAGPRLRVVATTSIIGDVVGRVGGDVVDLTVLLPPGTDSHSYQPGAQDLIAVENADVIFVNGWDLEGSLVGDLQGIGDGVIVVPISAGIVPLTAEEHGHYGDADDADHGAADPHVWFDISNVERWVENAALVLSGLDPANAPVYEAEAAVYLAELGELKNDVEARLGAVPAEDRKLVTNHDALGYFARAYGFDVIATVIPAASTLAEPSASDLADLIEAMEANGICTIFSEASVSDELAWTAAAELTGCPEVTVAALYTESLGPPGSGADTYIGMFTENVETIVEGLR